MLSGWNKSYLHLQFEIDVELPPMRCAIVKHQEPVLHTTRSPFSNGAMT